ncbi:MAG: alpha/beta fold hydrolase [Gammaproteobacteria bacterium]|nr:alpha/beta fold hydrolase [Gammaproteobacteria bacterium]
MSWKKSGKRSFVGALLCTLVFWGTGGASDLIREQRIAEQIEEAILVGDPVELEAGKVRFLAIHTEAETERPIGGVIILHGRGAHPDWVEVVQPLRSELPSAGWETLSLQMPVASSDAPEGAYEALIPEAYPRIAAGQKFLAARGITNVLLLGHSLGARMATQYLASEGAEGISALVVVGLSVQGGKGSKVQESIQIIRLPTLDIYGSQDLDDVRTTAGLRASAARRAKNRNYVQMEVLGADHFFNGLADDLVARVRSWIYPFARPGGQRGPGNEPTAQPEAATQG